jgi:tetratricopeptide (TPR) repeat protein
LLAERLQINHLLREKFLGSGTSDELSKLNQEITTDLIRYEALLRVQEKSFVLASPEFAKSLRSRSKDRQTLELIDDLKRLYKKHGLARIGFWYYMAATEYHSARKNYQEVVKLGLKFLKLVEQSPAVKSKTNIAGVNQTVGLAQLELRNYIDAKGHFSKAVTLFPVSGFNRLTGLQLLIQTETASNNISSALKYVELALQHPRLDTRDHLRPRLLFMKSSLEFLDNDIDSSFKTLNAEGYLTKQADEWNLQYRFLEMLQLVVQGDEEWLEFKLDATRKFLNRHKQLSNERTKLVIDLIAYMVRHDLQVDVLPDSLLVRLRKSLDEEKGFEWNPTGPELIRMDLWFTRKFLVLQDENSDKA